MPITTRVRVDDEEVALDEVSIMSVIRKVPS
jgi:hypothetical protein